MARHLHDEQREFRLHTAARSSDRLAFANELAKAPFADKVVISLDVDPDAIKPPNNALLCAVRAPGAVGWCWTFNAQTAAPVQTIVASEELNSVYFVVAPRFTGPVPAA